jgi:hypothetical protein
MQDLPRVSGGVNSFDKWQADYAAHKIATFPVGRNKKPMVKHYGRFGLVGSAAIANRFSDAPAIGFMCGKHNGVTVLDIDTTNERMVADAIDRHGETPVIARTGSGHYQAWYRYAGERRLIRPRRDVPIDILGGGFVVAPPSRVAKGSYEFLQGSLDDLDRLPTLHDAPAPVIKSEGVRQGARNNSLWRHCMRAAHHCDDFDVLLDVATTFNADCEPPMEDKEVIAAAQSAWDCTERGKNRFGQHGAYFPFDEIAAMIADQDAFILLAFLRAQEGPSAKFWCANGLAEKFGWTRKRLAEARRRLIELDYLVIVRQAVQGHPGLYRWA